MEEEKNTHDYRNREKQEQREIGEKREPPPHVDAAPHKRQNLTHSTPQRFKLPEDTQITG